MAVDRYSPITWGKEIISAAKLRQMADNDQYLFEAMPRSIFLSPGINKNKGLRIAAGKSAYPAVARDNVDVTVYFGTFFSVGCAPSVVVSVTSGYGLRKIAVVRGLSGVEPDHRGFIAHITTQENWVGASAKHQRISAGGMLHWQAVGW